MKVIVTGAAGFIGSHVVSLLVKNKYKVTCLIKKTTSLNRLKHISKQITFKTLENSSSLQNVIEPGTDGIIHLATKYIRTENGLKDIQVMSNSNITFPSLLLEEAARKKVKFFINTGTCFEYKQQQKVLDEKSELLPLNFYASTKTAFERILEYYTLSQKIRGLTLKLFFPYGEKDNMKIIPYIVNGMLNSKKIQLTEGKQKLDFTYVKDIARAYLGASQWIKGERYSKYEVFNIGASQPCTIRKVVRLLERISGLKSKAVWGSKPYALNEIMYMKCDNAKALKILKWRPEVTLEEGLENVFYYYKNNKSHV